MVGDGGLTMLMGELATLAKYKLNVKVVVIKNNVLGQIKWEQMVEDPIRNLAWIWSLLILPRSRKPAALPDSPSSARIRPSDFAARAGCSTDQQWCSALSMPMSRRCPGTLPPKQAKNFGEALLKGEKDRTKIIKTILEDKVREVV